MKDRNRKYTARAIRTGKSPHPAKRQCRSTSRGQCAELRCSLGGPFEAVLRVHVRRDNLDNLATLMREIAKSFSSDKRFRVDFQHLRNMGGTGGLTVQQPVRRNEMPAIKAALRLVYDDACRSLGSTFDIDQRSETPSIAAPKDTALARKADMPSGIREPYICYAAKPNSLLIRANGRIGKCTVALDDVRNDIGSLNADGTIALNNVKLRPWLRGFGTLDPESMGCPLRDMG